MPVTKLKLSSKIAILAFVLSFLGITALAFISYKQSNEIFKNNLVRSTAFETEKTAFDISKKIEEAKKNLLFASHSESIYGILRTTRNKYNYDEEQNMHISSWKERLTKLFMVIMKQNPSYFQMRLIGVKQNAKEMVRVEQKDEKILITPKDKLQSKDQSLYFKETIKLAHNQIYISHINLNREHNVIQTPFVPTLRVATPIYNGKKIYGIIVINIDVAKLFNFKKFKTNPNLQTFIVNCSGDYIYNKDLDKTFGFEFGREYRIQDDYKLKNFITHKGAHKKFYEDDINSAIAIEKITLSSDKQLYVVHIANSNFFRHESQSYVKVLILYIMGISIVIALLIAVLLRYLTSPITLLTKIAKNITDGKDVDFNAFNIKTGDEIEDLSNSFKFMVKSLSDSKHELQELANNLEVDVNEKTKALQKLNDELEIKVANAIKDIRQKDDALQQQSKLASMGEMIGAIAHQWRQPLNALGIQIQGLKYNYKNGEIDEQFIKEFIAKNKETIKFMSNTIDDFRSFFRVDKTKTEFKILETLKSVLSMQSAQLQNHNITVDLQGEEFEYFGLKSEFQQVILNIINNAKDALLEKNISQPHIIIEVDKSKKSLTICDNAGGIDKEVIQRVFEPYFTTKEQGKGTGMGLYMSKMIIEENMGSVLEVYNYKEGACFKIIFKEE
jgi:signal transduction histidine kinase